MPGELSALEMRLAAVARGRAVSVTYEEQDFIMALDYKVAFDQGRNAFDVLLRRGSCFEGAYRCLERWIEATAEQLDGVDGAPPDHLDLRREMRYWMIERPYDQLRADLDSAISDRIAWLEQERPGEGVLGEVTIEFRASALRGFIARLQHIDCEVRRALLSPETVAFLKDIGIDLCS
jgi:hypothetical protein